MATGTQPERPFPEGFTWGTATAAHQIEGGNVNSDWWAFEHREGSGVVEPSGDACDSWHRWSEDLDLVAAMGLGAYRFSVEWARIEPEPGEISVAALDHYARICEAARERGIEPVVTLHHFTSPRWLAGRDGWCGTDTPARFADYAHTVAAHLGDRMGRVCTINEPNIVAFCGHRLGVFPPGEADDARFETASSNFVDAHRRGVDAVREAVPGMPVGLTLSMAEWVAEPGGEDNLARYRGYMEDRFLDATGGDDFVGVQTYSRTRVGPEGVLGPEEGVESLDMGYELWPEALGATLRYAWERTGGRVPLIVTENGIGTTDDDQRIAYVHRALASLLDALDDGVDVRGYMYWSLLDNFEWAYGYRPLFGLHTVDRNTFTRSAKPSAGWFGRVALANTLLPPVTESVG